MDKFDIAGNELGAQLSESQGAASDRVREHLSDAYGVRSMFVRVNTLSQILGLAPATIRASMRAGRFALPHVVVCSAPLVRTDQLVDWILALDRSAQKPGEIEAKASPRPERDDDLRSADAPSRAELRLGRKRLVEETLAKMRAAGQPDRPLE